VRACAVWKIRLQALNVKPLTAWMVGLGRATDAEGYDAQVYDNSSKLYAQEIAVDSLRHSDWTVTVRYACTHLNLLFAVDDIPKCLFLRSWSS
jgi:hypothetical protein